MFYPDKVIHPGIWNRAPIWQNLVKNYDSSTADMLDRLTMSKIGMRRVNSLLFPVIDNIYTLESVVKDFSIHYADQITRLNTLFNIHYDTLSDYKETHNESEDIGRNDKITKSESLTTGTESKGTDKIVKADTGAQSDNLYGFNSPTAVGHTKTGTQTTAEQTNTVNNNIDFTSDNHLSEGKDSTISRDTVRTILRYTQSPAQLVEENIVLWARRNYYDILVQMCKEYFTIKIY